MELQVAMQSGHPNEQAECAHALLPSWRTAGGKLQASSRVIGCNAVKLGGRHLWRRRAEPWKSLGLSGPSSICSAQCRIQPDRDVRLLESMIGGIRISSQIPWVVSARSTSWPYLEVSDVCVKRKGRRFFQWRCGFTRLRQCYRSRAQVPLLVRIFDEGNSDGSGKTI